MKNDEAEARAYFGTGRIPERILPAMADLAATAMPPLSHLECMTCGRRDDIGSVADKLRNGWPTCHGYTMRLFTMREVEAQKPSS